MTVAQPSTPANYFHLLRRHAHDGIHRPLIVFTPKSMLRNKAAVSDIAEFTEMKFRSVLEEPTYDVGDGDRSKVKRILLVSGKLYYELVARKAKDKRDDIAIVRIEQLTRFPGTGCRQRWTATRTSRSTSGCRKNRRTRGHGRHSAWTFPTWCPNSRTSSGSPGVRCRRRHRARRRCTPSSSKRFSTKRSRR